MSNNAITLSPWGASRNRIPKEAGLWERYADEHSTEEGSWLSPEIYLELYVVNTYGLAKFKIHLVPVQT